MAPTEKQIAGLAASLGATLAVMNQNVPDLKVRALATLRKAIIARSAQLSKMDAQLVADMAAKIC
jgi:hypothetical protein